MGSRNALNASQGCLGSRKCAKYKSGMSGAIATSCQLSLEERKVSKERALNTNQECVAAPQQLVVSLTKKSAKLAKLAKGTCAEYQSRMCSSAKTSHLSAEPRKARVQCSFAQDKHHTLKWHTLDRHMAGFCTWFVFPPISGSRMCSNMVCCLQ